MVPQLSTKLAKNFQNPTERVHTATNQIHQISVLMESQMCTYINVWITLSSG